MQGDRWASNREGVGAGQKKIRLLGGPVSSGREAEGKRMGRATPVRAI